MTKKHTGPKLVREKNPTSSDDNKIPVKTIIITALLTGAATTLGVKLLEWSLEKGKQINPFKATNPTMNPGQSPGAFGPFQSPYSHMAQSQGLPFNHLPEAPPSPTDEETPPRWAQMFIERHEQRLAALEQQHAKLQVVEDGDEDAA